MIFKNNKVNEIEDLLILFQDVNNCPSNKEELSELLKGMKEAGFTENILDGAYYVRSFIAANIDTWASANKYVNQHIDRETLKVKEEQEKAIKEKVNLVHEYIKEEENWPKPEIVKNQSITFEEFVGMLATMPEEELENMFDGLPDELVKKIKETLKNVGDIDGV